jgi:Zn-dependent M28 family amino/carboxypeptidase
MKKLSVLLIPLLLAICGLSSCQAQTQTPAMSQEFDAQRAYQDVANQMQFGPRVPSSPAHQAAVGYIHDELQKAGWQVEIQKSTVEGHPVENILAKRSDTNSPIILGAHYDSRMLADQDPNPALRIQPVPGADDGASGVAVLLEIARVLPSDEKGVWLVFFDSEDQGEIDGWDWLLGSTAFADSLKVTPKAVVVIDMIGDADLNIYREISSTKALTDQIWQTAADLGYAGQFIDQEKYSMLDDQTSFLNKGLPAVDIIDFDYPYWHTTSDTLDKISADSLEIVGKTLLAWLAKGA